jgi:hypothetical protein
MNFDLDTVKKNIYPDFSSLANNLPRITPLSETFEKGNIIREIYRLNYRVEWLKIQKKDYSDRLNSIDIGSNVKLGLIISMAIVLFDIIIPFFFVVFSSSFDNTFGRIFLVVYLIELFLLSIISIFIYLVYIFNGKSQKKDN